jgi:hypothetical protein
VLCLCAHLDEAVVEEEAPTVWRESAEASWPPRRGRWTPRWGTRRRSTRAGAVPRTRCRREHQYPEQRRRRTPHAATAVVHADARTLPLAI